MKKVLLLLVLSCGILVQAQTGIGTTTPDASAKLDVSSTNKGFLPPRVTLTSATDTSTIPSAAEGLLVYNKGSVGLQAGYYYWNGANWATIATATSAGNGVTSADMVKLYGEAYSNAAGKIANANGYSFIVPVSGRYLFDFSSTGYNNNTNCSMSFFVRQGTTNLGTDVETAANNNVHVEYNGKVEVNLQAGTTYNVYVTWTGTRDGNDWDRVYMKQVAGNLPVTGQTVEYGIARYTGADTGSLSATSIVTFDATASGNLAWSGNKFTLKANKTYELESSLAIYLSSGGVGGRFQIYDYTNNVALVNGLFMSQNGAGTNNPSANSPMKGMVTPTTDIQVGVRLLDWYGPAGPGIIGSTSFTGSQSSPNASYFLVKQVGSSAIVNPWVLSGNDAYNTTGKVGIGTNAPSYTLDVNGTAKLTTTPSITTATSVLVKDPSTSQISEQPISFVTGVAKFILNTTSVSVSAGSAIPLNTTRINTISNYVSLNTSTGLITLQPGTYELNGSSGGLNGTGSTGDVRVYTMFYMGSAYVGTGGVSESGPAGNWNGMPQNEANHIVTVPLGQTAQIYFKVLMSANVASLSGFGDFGDNGDAGRAWVVVRKYN
jgi:hypothetical protein